MAAPVEESRVVKPYFPSLSNIALVKVSYPFFYHFFPETLDYVNEEFEQEDSSIVNDGCNENIRDYDRAKENLLWIPRHLRKEVVAAVYAYHYAIVHWMGDHTSIFGKHTVRQVAHFYNGKLVYSDVFPKVKLFFNWRVDGTIDRIKTARRLILVECFDVKMRFKMACMYCFEESIRTLWREMETYGETENFDERDSFVLEFWVRWLREGTRVPWTEAACEFLEIPDGHLFFGLHSPIRIASFFPLLRVEDRQKFLPSIKYAALDDLRFCLDAMTQEEASQVLRGFGLTMLLQLYILWPLQGSFLEIAEKVWNDLDVEQNFLILMSILKYAAERKDFDYFKLFERVWKKIPEQLRKEIKAFRLEGKKSLTFAKKFKMAKKAVHERTKKWIRKKGRLQTRKEMS